MPSTRWPDAGDDFAVCGSPFEKSLFKPADAGSDPAEAAVRSPPQLVTINHGARGGISASHSWTVSPSRRDARSFLRFSSCEQSTNRRIARKYDAEGRIADLELPSTLQSSCARTACRLAVASVAFQTFAISAARHVRDRQGAATRRMESYGDEQRRRPTRQSECAPGGRYGAIKNPRQPAADSLRRARRARARRALRSAQERKLRSRKPPNSQRRIHSAAPGAPERVCARRALRSAQKSFAQASNANPSPAPHARDRRA